MKTKEELNELKEEVETVNKNLAELTEEELEQISGGIHVETITVYTFGVGECFRYISGGYHVIYKVSQMGTRLKSNESVCCDEYYPDSNGGYALRYTNCLINAGFLAKCEELARNYV